MNKVKVAKTERIHSLDALRAIMMLLGLVLHSALTYNVTNHGDDQFIKDPISTHIFSDLIVLIIHSFRMQIFFIVAGFFGAMLFYEKHPMKMIKNRISRIVLPFLVFIFILYPFIIFSYGYTRAVFSYHQNPLDVAIGLFTDVFSYLPKETSHLWFLYYLTMITGTTVFIGFILKRTRITNNISSIFSWFVKKPFVRVIIFSAIVFVTLSLLKISMVSTSTTLTPDINTYIYYLVFYLFGWFLYKSKQHLASFMRYDWLFTIVAIIVVCVQGLIIKNYQLEPGSNSIVLILFSSVTVSFFASGITGLFVRYGSKYSERMRYISDSSYWIYLLHFPLTIIIPSFVRDLPLTAFGKFLVVLITTTVICFLTYHYFVRSTFIGEFLNGRKYPRESKKYVTTGIFRLSQIFR